MHFCNFYVILGKKYLNFTQASNKWPELHAWVLVIVQLNKTWQNGNSLTRLTQVGVRCLIPKYGPLIGVSLVLLHLQYWGPVNATDATVNTATYWPKIFKGHLRFEKKKKFTSTKEKEEGETALKSKGLFTRSSRRSRRRQTWTLIFNDMLVTNQCTVQQFIKFSYLEK